MLDGPNGVRYGVPQPVTPSPVNPPTAKQRQFVSQATQAAHSDYQKAVADYESAARNHSPDTQNRLDIMKQKGAAYESWLLEKMYEDDLANDKAAVANDTKQYEAYEHNSYNQALQDVKDRINSGYTESALSYLYNADPAHLNYVLAGLSDAELQQFASGMHTATGIDLPRDPKFLFDNLTLNADAAQQVRLASAFGKDWPSEASTLKSGLDRFNTADAAAKEKDKELAAQFAGLPLTPDQRTAYIRAFENDPANKEAYANREKAANALADLLKNNSTELYRQAATDPQEAAELKQVLSAVSNTSQAKIAVDFLTGASPEMINSLGGKAFCDPVMQAAMPNVMGRMVAEARSPQEAAQAFTQWLNGLKSALEIKYGWDDTGLALKMINEAAAGKYLNSTNPLKLFADDWTEKSGLSKGLAVAGWMVFMASAVQSGKEGNYLDAAASAATPMPGMAEVAAGALKAYNEAGKSCLGFIDADKAGVWAGRAGRLVPVLGMAAAGLAFAVHVQHLENPGNEVALVGDTASLVGAATVTGASLAELAGVTLAGAGPAGWVVMGAGMMLTGIGDGIAGWYDARQLANARSKYLHQIRSRPATPSTHPGTAPSPAQPLSEKLIGDIVSGRLAPLADRLGMTPEQIQAADTILPSVANASDVDLDLITRTMQSQGLTGDKAANFLFTVGAGHDGSLRNLVKFLDNHEMQTHFLRNPDYNGDPVQVRGLYDGLLKGFQYQYPADAAVLRKAGLQFVA